jgi:hypothetical protein
MKSAMAGNMTIEDEIEKALVDLAKDVAKKAGEVDILPDKVDALKTLSAVYLAIKKHKSNDPDDAQGDGFDFSKGVVNDPEEPPHDPTVTPIRSRRRPS